MLTREQIERHRQTYFTSLRISPEEWNALCDQAIKAIPADLLDDLIEYFDQRADVVDGSYGEPHPNREMQILQRLKELPAEQVPATPFLHSGDSGAATPARAGEPRCEAKIEPIAWLVTNEDGQDAYVTADPTLANSGQRAFALYNLDRKDVLLLEMYREQHTDALNTLMGRTQA